MVLMAQDLWDALNRIAARVAALSARDEELRSGIRALADALYALSEGPEAVGLTDAAGAESSGTLPPDIGHPEAVRRSEAPATAHAVTNGRDPSDAVLPAELAAAALTFARPVEPSRPVWQDFPGPPSDDDLPQIAARCRLKADGSRWAAERERRIAGGASFQDEVAPSDREIIARARATEGCYLWMNSPGWIAPPDLTLLEDLAGCFDVLAEALGAVLASRIDEGTVSTEALELLAAAQSAVWAAVARVSARTDPDQEKVFIWLRETASRQGVFISRHMRRDDPADPSVWRELASRVRQFGEIAGTAREQDRLRRKLLKKLAFIQARCLSGDEDPEFGRERFIATADELLALGLPPSHPELCGLTAALFDTDVDAGDGRPLSGGFRQVLRETARLRERSSAAGIAVAEVSPVVQDGPADVEGAVGRVETEFPDEIAFALNGRSEVRGNPFGEPGRLYAALRFLATTYRDARLGLAPCPDLDAECRRQSGFWYRPHQSDTAVGMFADDYQTLWRGRTLTLRSHLGKGISKDPRYTIRVAFDFDEERKVVVVGFLGQHQRTRST